MRGAFTSHQVGRCLDFDGLAMATDCTHPEQITKTFTRPVKSPRHRPVRLYDLRRGAAWMMLAGGGGVAVVSKRLGHSSSHLLAGFGRGAAHATEALGAPQASTLAIPPDQHAV